MKKVLHRAETRGSADHGWLRSRHTFSFAGYYDPERVHFGALRVLNDDTLAPGEGFGTHPHENMEIITLVLSGALRHVDSMGDVQELRPGGLQVMTAGTGLRHSLTNASCDEPARFLQIWIRSDAPGHAPRYRRIEPPHAGRNALRLIVAPEGCGSEHVGAIHQTAWLYTLDLEAAHAAQYRMNVHGDGAYVFVIEGEAEVAGEPLGPRDGAGIADADDFLVRAVTDARLLIIEVPMH